eukprot:TRINITY_DN4617_c0_g5_i1.p1 TRINITY_DN4617_c0_g5~~TRINITY_DN4617_c0_g5_i1.p1  ORF type:complete len:1430 (-),score=283.76 TRINITY_DN4617_c0_g5_i1:129-4418(-)
MSTTPLVEPEAPHNGGSPRTLLLKEAEVAAKIDRFIALLDKLKQRLDVFDTEAKMKLARKLDKVLEEHKPALAKATGIDSSAYTSATVSSVLKRLQKISDALNGGANTGLDSAVVQLAPLLASLDEIASRHRSSTPPARLARGGHGRSHSSSAGATDAPIREHNRSSSSETALQRNGSADIAAPGGEMIRIFLADGSSKNFVTDVNETAQEFLQRVIGKLGSLNKDFIRGVSLWEVPFNTLKGAADRQILPSENLAHLKRNWRRPSRFYLFTKFEAEMRSASSQGANAGDKTARARGSSTGSGISLNTTAVGSPVPSPRSPLPSPRVVGSTDSGVKLLLEDGTFKSFIVTPTETWAAFKKRALAKLQQQLDINPATFGIFIFDADDQEYDFEDTEAVLSSLSKLTSPRVLVKPLESAHGGQDSARAQKKNEKAVSIITTALRSTKSKKLSLANLQLRDLPNEIKLMAPTASHVDLSGNSLTTVSEQLVLLQHLKSLNLSNNRISAVPSFVGGFSHMRILDLSSNRLTYLPPDIGSLSHLTSLCLSNNRLTFLPLEMGRLAQLEELTLGGNGLSDLPESFSALFNLRMIDISSNSFSKLPEVMKELGSLEELYSSSNQIQEFPVWLCSLSLLRSLDFTNNALHTIPEEIGQLRSLEELLVGNNPMAGGIPVERIQTLVHLSRLQLPDESLAEYVLTHLENPKRAGQITQSSFRSHKSVADLIGGNMGAANIIPGAGHFGDRRSGGRQSPQFKAMSLSDEELLLPGGKQQHGTFGSDDDSFSAETPGGSLLSASDSSGGLLVGSPGSAEDSTSILYDDYERPGSLEKSSSFERPSAPLRERSNSRGEGGISVSPRQRTFVRSSSSKVSLVAQAAINTQMAAAIEKETQKRTANPDANSAGGSGGHESDSSSDAATYSPRLEPSSDSIAASASSAGVVDHDYGHMRVRKAGPSSSSSSIASSPASAGSPVSMVSNKRKSFATKRPLSENMIPKDSSSMSSRVALLASEGMPPALPSIPEMPSPGSGPSSPNSSSSAGASLYAPALLIHAQVIGTSYHVETGRDLSGQLPPGKDAIYSPLNLKIMDFYQEDYFTHFHQFPHVNLIAVDPSVGPVVASILLVKEQRRRADVFRALVRTTSGDVTTFIPGDGASWDSGSPSRKKSKTFMELHALKLLKKQMVGQIDLSNARIVRSPEFSADLLTFESRIQANAFKFGVLYCAAGQSTEDEFYGNENPSPAFEEFTDFLAEKIRLKGWRRYNGGLDTEADRTGKYALYRRWATTEIVFHVSTMLPYRSNDEQQIERKKHIGNDVVVIVFQDEGAEPFDPRTVRSVFNHVFIVVRALPLQGPGASRYYQIAVVSKSGVKEHTPLLPRPAIFEKSPGLLRFLFTKLINAERASYSAIGFAPAIARTRLMLLQELTQKHIAAQRHKKRQ